MALGEGAQWEKPWVMELELEETGWGGWGWGAGIKKNISGERNGQSKSFWVLNPLQTM